MDKVMRSYSCRLYMPRERLGELTEAARLVARALTREMQMWRASDVSRPTYVDGDLPRRPDSKAVDWKAALGPVPKVYAYPEICRFLPTLSTGIIAATNQHCRNYYRKHRPRILLGQERTPEFTKAETILIRGQNARIVRQDKDRYELQFTLWSKRDSRPRCAAWFFADRHPEAFRKALDRYATGEERLPEIKLTCGRSRKSRKKWWAHICCPIEPGAAPLREDRTLIVRRPNADDGFLVCMIQFKNRPPWTEALEWESALRTTGQVEKRRIHIQNKYRCDEQGRRNGHGLRRAVEALESLSDASFQLKRNFNRQRARRVVRTALRWRCATVSLEDLTKPDPETLVLGRWSYHEFNQQVASNCEAEGIACKLFDPTILKKGVIDGKKKRGSNGKGQGGP